MFITFLGPDGSGKSTLIEKLEEKYRKDRIIQRFHLRPRWAERWAEQWFYKFFTPKKAAFSTQPQQASVTQPHFLPKRSALFSVLKVLYFWLDYTLAYWLAFRSYAENKQKSLVIFDRSLPDIWVDPTRYRYAGPEWLLKWAIKTMPQPDHYIILDAPVWVLQSRKQEVSAQETARQKLRYLELQKHLPNSTILDSSQPIEVLIKTLEEKINQTTSASTILEDIVLKAFPNGSRLIDPSKDTESKKQFKSLPEEQRFFILKDHTNYPRWVLNSVGIYNQSVFENWRPFRQKSLFFWKILSVMAKVNLLKLLPFIQNIGVEIPKQSHLHKSLWHAMGWQSLRPPALNIYIGSPNAFQKVTCFLMNQETSKLERVAKVPIGIHAKKYLLNEAHILQIMHENPKIQTNFYQFNANEKILTLNPIGGYHKNTALTALWSQAHHTFLNQLRLEHETITLNEFKKYLQGRYNSLKVNSAEYNPNWINSLLQFIKDDTTLPAFWVHGDFTPWNLYSNPKKHQDNYETLTLEALDWEFSKPKCLPLQDLYHFFASIHPSASNNYFFEENPILCRAVNAYCITHCLEERLITKLLVAYLLDRWLLFLEGQVHDKATLYYHWLLHCLTEIQKKEAPHNKKLLLNQKILPKRSFGQHSNV